MECHAFSLISVIKKFLIHAHIWFFPRFLICHVPVVLINVLTCLDKMESYFAHANLKWLHSFYPVSLTVPLPCLRPPVLDIKHQLLFCAFRALYHDSQWFSPLFCFCNKKYTLTTEQSRTQAFIAHFLHSQLKTCLYSDFLLLLAANGTTLTSDKLHHLSFFSSS